MPVKEKEKQVYAKDLSRLLKILIITSSQLEKLPPLQY